MFHDALAQHKTPIKKSTRQQQHHRRSSHCGSSTNNHERFAMMIRKGPLLESPPGAARRRTSLSSMTTATVSTSSTSSDSYNKTQPKKDWDSFRDDPDEDDRTGLLTQTKCKRRFSLDGGGSSGFHDGGGESMWSKAHLRLSGGPSFPGKIESNWKSSNSMPGSPSGSSCSSLKATTPTSSSSGGPYTRSKMLNVMTLMRKDNPNSSAQGGRQPQTYAELPGRSTDDDNYMFDQPVPQEEEQQQPQQEGSSVKLWEGSAPLRTADGHLSAEIVDPDRKNSSILVQYYSPWPLLLQPGGGGGALEVGRDAKPERAFVDVISAPMSSKKLQGKRLTNAVLDQILGPTSKFGMDGYVSNIKCKCITPGELLLATFWCGKEERRMFLKLRWATDSTLIILAVHTTVNRFISKERLLLRIADSLVLPAAKI